MKFKFSIGRKIGIGFGILILLTLAVFLTTYITLQESRRINDVINEVNTPSVKALQELKFSILETKLFLETWVKYPKLHEDKERLSKFRNRVYPDLESQLLKLSKNWTDEHRLFLEKTISDIELLFYHQEQITESLASFEDYSYDQIFLANYSLEEGGDVYETTQIVLSDLDSLIEAQKQIAFVSTLNMFKSFDALKSQVLYLGVALIIIGILIAIYTTRTIVLPVQRLKAVLVKLGKGVFPEGKMKVGNDEIGEMTAAMNNVVSGLQRTKDFATEVGAGKFDTEYKPLSSKDSFGKALMKMRDDLAENERNLGQKVMERTAEVVRQKEEIEKQSQQIEEYFIQVTDSIKYAKRIQDAILPPEGFVKEVLPESFILFRPKAIVSGDFYWIEKVKDKIFFAAVDCTGHGVPGAFMSIVGSNNLKQALITTGGQSPSNILNELNKGVTETLHQKEENSTSKDGMDVAMCSINFKNLELEYAGAFNPLYIIRNDKIIQFKGNKFPIGSYSTEELMCFSNEKVQLEKGDRVYIFTDGYPDQFGGPKGKKFMYKRFRETLLKYSKLPMQEQKEVLNNTLMEWMGEEEQVDDILVMGVKV